MNINVATWGRLLKRNLNFQKSISGTEHRSEGQTSSSGEKRLTVFMSIEEDLYLPNGLSILWLFVAFFVLSEHTFALFCPFIHGDQSC